EYVFSADATRGNVGLLESLHSALRGTRPFEGAGDRSPIPGYVNGGLVTDAVLPPVAELMPLPIASAPVDLSGIETRLDAANANTRAAVEVAMRATATAERVARVAADTRANPAPVVVTRRNAGQIGRLSAERARGSRQRLGRPNTRSGNPR
ncbi:MAG: hypothetical protein AAGN64_02230, partial [Bacteroidota bacterium]